MQFAAIVVTYNSAKTIRQCLQHLCGLRSSWAPRTEASTIYVVDNASNDNTAEIVKMFEGVELIQNEINIGFGAANNLVLSKVRAEFYLLINCDAYIDEKAFWIAHWAICESPTVGIVGFPLVYPDGKPQPAAYSFTSVKKKVLQTIGVRDVAAHLAKFRFAFRLLSVFEISRSFLRSMSGVEVTGAVVEVERARLFLVDWVCGAAMLIRGDIVTQGLLFDENFFLYYEDEDLCIQAAAKGVGVAQINCQPIIHDCGWDKSRRVSRINRERLKSASYFLGKNFANRPISRCLLRGMLRLAPGRW